MEADPPCLMGKATVTGKNAEDAPVATTGVVSTACQKGDLGNWGRPTTDEGRGFNVIGSGDGLSWASERVI